jgi:hypothetical protein
VRLGAQHLVKRTVLEQIFPGSYLYDLIVLNNDAAISNLILLGKTNYRVTKD